MIFVKKIFFYAIFLLSISHSTIFDLIKINTTSALCLDGSHAAYYVSRQGDPNKIILFFESGGWCGWDQGITQQLLLEDCYQRSKGVGGSSNYLVNSMQITDGYSSFNNKNYFHDWKKVIINYCDGSGHQGYKKQPVIYKDKKLYFRGHNNTIQTLQSLQQKIKIFSQATHVVVGGGSAGGLAVYFWVDYIASRVKTGKVWGLPDSGIFVDFNHIKYNRPIFQQIYGNIMKIVNNQVDIPVFGCVNEFKQQKVKCFFAQNLINHIKTPLFFFQPLYDSFSIQHMLGMKCMSNFYQNINSNLTYCNQSQVDFIEKYHQKMKNIITQNIQKNKKNGVWAAACINHGYGRIDQYFTTNKINGITASQAIKNWIEDTHNKNPEKYQIIDKVNWPKNHLCNGLNSLNQQIKLILFVLVGFLLVILIIATFIFYGKTSRKIKQINNQMREKK